MSYVCAACGGVFEQGWSEEERLKEFREHFGHDPAPDDPTVCDDCYPKIMKFNEGPDWNKMVERPERT